MLGGAGFRHSHCDFLVSELELQTGLLNELLHRLMGYGQKPVQKALMPRPSGKKEKY